MADITTHAHGSTWSFSLSRVFRGIGDALITLTEANSRVRQAEALQALSDEELAKHGLKRQEIARYVFSDMFYI